MFFSKKKKKKKFQRRDYTRQETDASLGNIMARDSPLEKDGEEKGWEWKHKHNHKQNKNKSKNINKKNVQRK